jgi:hypothetical protein
MMNPRAEGIQGWNTLIIRTLSRLNRLDRDPLSSGHQSRRLPANTTP